MASGQHLQYDRCSLAPVTSQQESQLGNAPLSIEDSESKRIYDPKTRPNIWGWWRCVSFTDSKIQIWIIKCFTVLLRKRR